MLRSVLLRRGSCTMHKDTLLPLKRLEAAQKARKVALLETMIRDFATFAVDLAQQIAPEEERTRIRDPRHVAYSTFATAAAARRRNLLASTADLTTKLNAAQHELQQAIDGTPRSRIGTETYACNSPSPGARGTRRRSLAFLAIPKRTHVCLRIPQRDGVASVGIVLISREPLVLQSLDVASQGDGLLVRRLEGIPLAGRDPAPNDAHIHVVLLCAVP